MKRLIYCCLTAGVVGTTALAQEAGCRYALDVPEKGNLSAAVYRADGTLVRTLQCLRPAVPGTVELYWDGLDDFGQASAPGVYAVRTVLSDVTASFVMTVANGINPSRPDDLGQVRAGRVLTVDPNGRLILAGGIGGESPRSLQLFTLDGKFIRDFETIYQPTAVATDGRYAYLTGYRTIEGRPLAFVYRLDLEAEVETAAQVDYPGPGGTAPFPDRTVMGTPGKYFPAGSWHAVYHEPDPRHAGENVSAWGTAPNWWQVHSLACSNGKLYIAVPSTDRIVVMDADSGKVVEQITVTDVTAVAVGPQGRLFVCAGAEALVMDTDGGNRTVFARGFDAPYCLTVDRQGNVVVVDHGGRRINYSSTVPKLIKLSPEGRILFTLGKDGGVGFLDGKIAPHKFYYPAALAVDEAGNMYLAEPTLPRVQKLAPDGSPQFSLLTIYAEEMCVDPKRPEEFYSTGSNGQVRRYILDYENRTWRLDACWRRTLAPYKFMTVDMRVAHAHGDRFLVIWDAGLFRIDDYKLRYVKQTVTPMILEDGTAYPIELNDKTAEISLWEMPCAGYDADGCPIYRNQDKKLVCRTDPAFNKTHGVGPKRRYHLYIGAVDPDRNLYITASKRGRGKGIPYWARMWEKVYLQKYDRAGRLRWAVGRKTSSFVQPGEFYGPNRVRYHDGFVYHSDVSGVASIFDPDGLMVGFVVKDSARGIGFDEDPLGGCGEAWCHHLVTHPNTGKLYYIHQDHSTGQYRVLEFKGLENLRYAQGNVTLKQAAEPHATADEQRQDYVATIFKAGKLSLDGDLSEWADQASTMLWAEQDNRNLPHAKLRYRYDQRCFYVALQVFSDDTPAVNRNASARDLLWRGDCLELYIGTDIKSWRKGEYAATDYQLMLAPGPDANGKAYCQNLHTWIEGSQVAWKIDADRKGYTLEAKVPWSFFRGPEPKAGKRIPFDMRVMCGDKEGKNYAYNLIWSARNMAFNRTNEWGQAVLEHFAVSSEIEVIK